MILEEDLSIKGVLLKRKDFLGLDKNAQTHPNRTYYYRYKDRRRFVCLFLGLMLVSWLNVIISLHRYLLNYVLSCCCVISPYTLLSKSLLTTADDCFAYFCL